MPMFSINRNNITIASDNIAYMTYNGAPWYAYHPAYNRFWLGYGIRPSWNANGPQQKHINMFRLPLEGEGWEDLSTITFNLNSNWAGLGQKKTIVYYENGETLRGGVSSNGIGLLDNYLVPNYQGSTLMTMTTIPGDGSRVRHLRKFVMMSVTLFKDMENEEEILNTHGICLYDSLGNKTYDSRYAAINLSNIVALQWKQIVHLSPGSWILPLYTRATGGLLATTELIRSRVNGPNAFRVDSTWGANNTTEVPPPSLIYIYIESIPDLPAPRILSIDEQNEYDSTRDIRGNQIW